MEQLNGLLSEDVLSRAYSIGADFGVRLLAALAIFIIEDVVVARQELRDGRFGCGRVDRDRDLRGGHAAISTGGEGVGRGRER